MLIRLLNSVGNRNQSITRRGKCLRLFRRNMLAQFRHGKAISDQPEPCRQRSQQHRARRLKAPEVSNHRLFAPDKDRQGVEINGRKGQNRDLTTSYICVYVSDCAFKTEIKSWMTSSPVIGRVAAIGFRGFILSTYRLRAFRCR